MSIANPKYQDWFNQSVKGLASQGFEPAILKDDFSCCYRTDDGKKCAIGWLIPDELYETQMEGNSIPILIDGFSEIRKLFDVDNLTSLFFLKSLQQCHDCSVVINKPNSIADTPNKMKNSLRKLALRYNLELPSELQEQV